jgi:transcriptional regulator with XRE-family HTH domain
MDSCKTIKDARRLAGLTQKQLAQKYNIPLRTLQGWDAGYNTPPQYMVDTLIARILADHMPSESVNIALPPFYLALNDKAKHTKLEISTVNDTNDVNLKSIYMFLSDIPGCTSELTKERERERRAAEAADRKAAKKAVSAEKRKDKRKERPVSAKPNKTRQKLLDALRSRHGDIVDTMTEEELNALSERDAEKIRQKEAVQKLFTDCAREVYRYFDAMAADVAWTADKRIRVYIRGKKAQTLGALLKETYLVNKSSDQGGVYGLEFIVPVDSAEDFRGKLGLDALPERN